MRETFLGGGPVMHLKRFKPEQIVTLPRQIEVEIANGKTAPQACHDAALADLFRHFARHTT
jgi:hypothetical protein